jgi:hypothetical protein
MPGARVDTGSTRFLYSPTMEKNGQWNRAATGDRGAVPSAAAICGSSPTPSPPMRKGHARDPKPSALPAFMSNSTMPGLITRHDDTPQLAIHPLSLLLLVLVFVLVFVSALRASHCRATSCESACSCASVSRPPSPPPGSSPATAAAAAPSACPRFIYFFVCVVDDGYWVVANVRTD